MKEDTAKEDTVKEGTVKEDTVKEGTVSSEPTLEERAIPGRSEKAALREEMRALLAGIPEAEAREAAERMVVNLLSLPEMRRARNVFCCLSFGTEIDTRRLIRRLDAASGVESRGAEGLESAGARTIYVPRNLPGRRLALHPYPCDTRFTSYGLEQPVREAPRLADEAIDTTIEIALVLGLAFDRQGYRLGHGAGYFDRFLDGRPFPAIGLAYSAQVLDGVPREAHDLPMAAIVTDRGILRPGRDGMEPASPAHRRG